MLSEAYNPQCQDRDAGLLFSLRRNPPLVELKLRRGLGDSAGTIQATGDLCFMEDVERWLPVVFPLYRERYEVSSWGRLRSFIHAGGTRRTVPRLVKPYPSFDGKLRYSLYAGPRIKYVLVSRLVLLTFVGDPPEGCEGSHLDGNGTNNRLDNLKWETHIENEARKKDHGTRCSGAKLNEQIVIQLRLRHGNGETAAALREELAPLVSLWTVYNAIVGRTWKSVSARGGK